MGFADGYNTVPERIIEFREKYPDGTLQRVGPLEVFEIEGATYLAYTAAAYRTPDDERPGVGTAWERVPGLSNFTKNSELQNAETSAWGRAIIAVGAADAKKGIASREDVQNRQADVEPPVPGFRSSLIESMNGLTAGESKAVRAWLKEQGLPMSPAQMTQEQSDRVCDFIVHMPKVEDQT